MTKPKLRKCPKCGTEYTGPVCPGCTTKTRMAVAPLHLLDDVLLEHLRQLPGSEDLTPGQAQAIVDSAITHTRESLGGRGRFEVERRPGPQATADWYQRYPAVWHPQGG